MDINTYVELSGRTECDQRKSLDRLKYTDYKTPDHLRDDPLLPVRINHAIIGMTGEIGELAGALEKWIYYGQHLDVVNIKEEIGDVLWYIALLCRTCKLDLNEIMEANIAKLRKRFPDKYTDERAAEEGRDRQAERKTLETHTPNLFPVKTHYHVTAECDREDRERTAELNK